MNTSDKKRNKPKQERAKKTVGRILESAENIILEKGIDSLTTNKVADNANINIATLYHYFSDKDAILEALAEEYQRQIIDFVQSRTESISELNLEETIKVILYGFIAFIEKPGNALIPHLILSRMSGSSGLTNNTENSLLQLAISILSTKSNEIKSDNLYVSTYIVFYSTLAVIGKHLKRPNNLVRNEDVVEELAKMICSYLGSPYVGSS